MTTTSVTCEIRLAEAIKYPACSGGDREVILHLRQRLGVNFYPRKERQRMKESLWRRRRPKEKKLETTACASVPFVHCCFIGVEGRVLVLSVSSDKGLLAFKHNFLLLVCWACFASGRLGRKKGIVVVWAHRRTHERGHLQRLIWWWEVTVVHHARL